MLIWPECIPCILKMTLDVARLALHEKDITPFMKDVLTVPALRGEEWHTTAPDIIRVIWEKMIAVTHDPDPLKKVKREQNMTARGHLDRARDYVVRSGDPFTAALRLAISGNAIDAMRDVTDDGGDPLSGNDGIFPEGGAAGLRERIGRSRKIVYLLDNSGEAVFDRLLLEVIRDMGERDITIVARSLPVLNDINLSLIDEADLGGMGTITGNGIPFPYPGTRLGIVSDEVRGLLLGADLVIAKGGGNQDSLTEETELAGRISYLFHGKCRPLCEPRKAPQGALIVDNC